MRLTNVPVVACVCLGGCLYGSPPAYQYVLQKGNTDAIARWTLNQRDHGGLVDGRHAISSKVGTAHSPEEAQHAIDAYLRVATMIENWPADTKIPVQSGAPPASRDEEVGYSFSIVANDIWHNQGNAYLSALFWRLRPSHEAREWSRMWESERRKIGNRLCDEQSAGRLG